MATTSIPANCEAVTQALQTYSSSQFIQGMIKRIAQRRPIVKHLFNNRGSWMNGQGYTQNVMTFEKSFPALTGDGWTAIAASDGDAVNACRPPTETVSFGTTNRTVTPKQYAVETEDFCIKDIQSGIQFAEWLTNVNSALERISEWVWARRFTQDYFTIAGHKITLNSKTSPTDSPTAYNTSSSPTSTLTQGFLDNIKMSIVREGDPMYIDEGTGEYMGTVILSPEMSQQIIRNNPDLVTANLWAHATKGDASPLAPGVPTKRRNYGGWVHEIEMFPRRFILSGGAYIEIASHVSAATTKGNKWSINPDWLAAPFEEVIVYNDGNYQSLAVNTLTNPAPGWNFNPVNWLGDFSPRNILDRTCNPDGTQLFMRALYADAAKPGNPELGYTILAKRCNIANNAVSCYGYSV